MPAAPARENIPDFEAFGIIAFTTTREAGSFGTMSDEPVRAVMARWDALRASVQSAMPPSAARFATSKQVHGTRVVEHDDGWEGWLRTSEADGHFAPRRGTAMAVTIADCVPIFIAHPEGAVALLHSGWRGTAARIIERALAAFSRQGLAAGDLRVHLGPAICGACYEVSADVAAALTGAPATGPQRIDLRALIAEHARLGGVSAITSSEWCTRCNNTRFFSHRAGDIGRQVAVMVARTEPPRVDSP
ncbi:MAG: polyphenol oxidase family protein [Gemmatimonas sp.]|nr:polyphenol oxidase family protein [Gemmatimonadaceae bacterium]